MAFGKKKVLEEPEVVVVDHTGWLLASSVAEFILMHTHEIKYMCMFGYTFYHGSNVFGNLGKDSPLSFKFINMILACTGGGIFVPIFINAIPVPLCQDAYPIAILVSFLLHQYIPILREVMKLSAVFQAVIIFLYECLRASVVVKLTAAAGSTIPASDFSFPIFGPIFCGAVAGCGGAFLPLNKGLDPIKKDGLAPAMMSALIAATFYHLFVNTSLSEGVVDAPKKAHVVIAICFILHHFSYTFKLFARAPKVPITQAKKES